jgi:hypothetical protein
MITVKNAWHKHGYSGSDHLLSDSELEDVIGREFRSVSEAKKSAARLSTGTSGYANVPIGLEVRFADGTTKTF